MNAFQVDSATGFLTSPSPTNYGFTADKKVKFLELALGYRKQGLFPRVNDICSAVGIDLRTFERHIEADEVFKSGWKEISTQVEYDCISDMSDLRKKNPMYMFGLLRYLNPKRWNPNEKQTIDLNINMAPQLISKAGAIDAELSSITTDSTVDNKGTIASGKDEI